MQEAIFTAALGIESPWFVESVAFDSEHKRLDIRLDFKRGGHAGWPRVANERSSVVRYDHLVSNYRGPCWQRRRCLSHWI